MRRNIYLVTTTDGTKELCKTIAEVNDVLAGERTNGTPKAHHFDYMGTPRKCELRVILGLWTLIH
jgi:hypothetical protein